MSKKNQHVIPSKNGWGVLSSGAKRASRTFGTQQEAIANAREKAKKQGTELCIHGRDGRIRERNSYGRHSLVSGRHGDSRKIGGHHQIYPVERIATAQEEDVFDLDAEPIEDAIARIAGKAMRVGENSANCLPDLTICTGPTTNKNRRQPFLEIDGAGLIVCGGKNR